MPVIEVLGKTGAFEFELSTNVSRDVLDAVSYFGHIALIPGRVNPEVYGDGLLSSARYIGVVRNIELGDDGRTNRIQDNIRVRGCGMNFWLGDEDGKGAVIETAKEYDSFSFANTITDLLPASVTAGNISTAVSGTYSGRHQWETPRQAITYVCDTMSTVADPIAYRVNGDGTLDAGPHSELFVTEPKCVVVRKGTTPGEDMHLRALPGSVDFREDVEDFTTRVVMLAEGSGENINTGSADISPALNPYKDIHGNVLNLTRMVSESDTTVQNADTRAELALNQFTNPHREFALNTWDYDIQGSFDVGDYVWVYDPDLGLTDTSNQVYFRGALLTPILLQVTEAEWAITEEFTVAYRAADGTWINLTDMIHFDQSTFSKFVVGDPTRTLIEDDESAIGIRTGIKTEPDTSTPAAPTWVVSSFQTVIYLDNDGFAQARQKLVWDIPLNTDGTAVQDGMHFEIQYRLDTAGLYSQTWGAASTQTWEAANTWVQPVEPDTVQWESVFVGWGENSTVIHELATGTGYDFRIRAVDAAGNQSAWSIQETLTTSEDDIPPSTPAAPTVASSMLAIQVTHELGKASGGTFNLEKDLAHLEVHYSYDNGFFPSEETKAGLLRANKGMMAAQTPAIDTFTIPETENVYVKVVAVDRSGNRSGASAAAQSSAVLIDSQHVSEITASKISAGTVSANWLLAGSIRTAETGARIDINSTGIQAYNSENEQTLDVNAETGDVELVGTLKTKSDTAGSIQINSGGISNDIRFYSPDGSNFAVIRSLDEPDLVGSDATLKLVSSFDENSNYSISALLNDRALYGRAFTDDAGYIRNQGGTVFMVDGEVYAAHRDKSTQNFGGVFLGQGHIAVVGYSGGADITFDASPASTYFTFANDGVTRHYGTWLDWGTYNSTTGTLTGHTQVDAGATPDNFTIISYGVTLDSVAWPLGNIVDQDATNLHIELGSNITTTSFQFNYNTDASGLYEIFWWAYRLET